MTWTNPKTWTSEPLTSTDMNTHIRDNLNALKSPPTAVGSMSAAYTVPSVTVTDITGASLTITTNGGNVMVGFTGYMRSNNDLSYCHLSVMVDAGADMILATAATLVYAPVGGMAIVQGIAAGAHTIKFRANMSATETTGIVRLYHLWAREIS